MPNSAIVPNPQQFPETPQEYIKYLLKMRGISVQKMCDDLYPALSKSTVDKWLSFQTTETSFSNVKAMVKYLGGSLDYLAQIEASAQPEPAPAPAVPEEAKKAFSSHPSMELANFLVESYEKEIRRNAEHHQQEIQRVTDVHERYLSDVVSLVETGRQALITQHNSTVKHMQESCDSAIAHTKALCDSIVQQKQEHLDSFKAGRNVWRTLALFAIGAVTVLAVWLVWEFSNLDLGLTGHLLRQAGLISMAGPGGV